MACNDTGLVGFVKVGFGFNPWRVFSWLATRAVPAEPQPQGGVSIPGGFFRGLQPYGRGADLVAYEAFQSLAGFFVACNKSRTNTHGRPDQGFNPWRVFSWLATTRPTISINRPICSVSIPGGFFRGLQPRSSVGTGCPVIWFQSLAGFFVACNRSPTLGVQGCPLVSIPGGFFRGLQPPGDRGFGDCSSRFNPWRVFSWLATYRSRSRPQSRVGFNPWRVFSWLATHRPQKIMPISYRGFNPWRVFSWLATRGLRLEPARAAEFQSLAGFFVACNLFGVEPTKRFLIQFQSLAGFFVACNSQNTSAVDRNSGRFNPWRVFSWLATSTGSPVESIGIMFQSLAGFFVACNGMPRVGGFEMMSFNPWRVFSWLATASPPQLGNTKAGFNPWRVFSWLATSTTSFGCFGECQVSIPGGFFRGLQRRLRSENLEQGLVSIPGGFFRGLQRCGWPTTPPVPERFQSLAGFFVACNVLVALRCFPSGTFQSLAGFFVACNFRELHSILYHRNCFNPWRVFSWLATSSCPATRRVLTCFNPWRVFSWLATAAPMATSAPVTEFQSLAGFFVACNPIRRHPNRSR